MTPKPAYEELAKLINDAWRTRTTLRSGPDGTATFRGFRGRYRLTAKSNAGTGAAESTLGDDGNNRTVTIA